MTEADALARQCADALWDEDTASRGLGMALDHVAAGQARMSMLVRPEMVNGHGLCHGGFIFALADSAMAFAANSHGERAVAQHNGITYISAQYEAGKSWWRRPRNGRARDAPGFMTFASRDRRMVRWWRSCAATRG
jgi:hypothetical protein